MSCQKMSTCWIMLLARSVLSVLFCAVTSVQYSITQAWHNAEAISNVANSLQSGNYSVWICWTDVTCSSWLIKLSWWISCWFRLKSYLNWPQTYWNLRGFTQSQQHDWKSCSHLWNKIKFCTIFSRDHDCHQRISFFRKCINEDLPICLTIMKLSWQS
jgi:hypothetical protein